MKRIIPLIFFGIVASQDSVLKETFDASAIQAKDPDWPAVMDPLIKNTADLDKALGLDSTQLIREGFRVQVFASSRKEKADSLKFHLDNIMQEPVFVTFEVPLYKVRVGNCITRKEAERLQARLNEIGYRNAWIIRSRIEPQKPY
ncbi:MAG: SPOR domain-containing protein [Candidatus Marinimicrobia bacterium]|jgi:hypothetical protein|nr:SPOR domain-containing protein [Candidatus Neomarinimicrobiota bacterium]MDP6789593.1 SPOR domain-containing protein [Candidatus Neomarinimicrobiota bacterium]